MQKSNNFGARFKLIFEIFLKRGVVFWYFSKAGVVSKNRDK
ncbi:hypothetical protein D8844_04250 [Streptococcus oralis]|uniref:Uncharacterized protein n=1 Tax=Streptococcus oralis TaxID=1303 RepID=A0A3R9LND5_STROR|nr:hypothetical protein D8835_03950 [Streptococcus oralis]RSK18053.1 hypothetical protein D8844_04250 [Streptococcus oralis]